MQNDYASFLDFRATQRQLATKFARPWLLLVHVLAFLVVMTGTWVYGSAWRLWFYRDNYTGPVLVGAVWSLLLLGHAVAHYRRSAANAAQREQAVEQEMRAFMQKHRSAVDSSTLIEMHRALEDRLAGFGRWSAALTAFAVVNAASWVFSVFNIGSSWSFQMTPIFAAVLIGGTYTYLRWRHERENGRRTWLTRLPLLHIIAYLTATVVLGLLGALRAVNPWDVNTLVEWGLVAVIVYSIWCVLVAPTVQWAGGLVGRREQLAKHKPPQTLALGDDGELMPLDAAAASPAEYEDTSRGARQTH